MIIIKYIDGKYIREEINYDDIFVAPATEEPLTMDDVLSVLEAALNE